MRLLLESVALKLADLLREGVQPQVAIRPSWIVNVSDVVATAVTGESDAKREATEALGRTSIEELRAGIAFMQTDASPLNEQGHDNVDVAHPVPSPRGK